MENINLTRNGVMMSNGLVISSDVSVNVLTDGSIRMHYTDESNTLRSDIRSICDISINRMDNRDRTINAILSENDDYLVIWNPVIDNCF